MGNCTGCEDQQLNEQRNEILYDKNRKRCNENIKLIKNTSKKNQDITNKENQSPTLSKPTNKSNSLADLHSTNLNLPETQNKKELKLQYSDKNMNDSHLDEKYQPNVIYDENPNIPTHLHRLEQMPNYLNEYTRMVVEKLGEFQYEDEGVINLAF